MRPEPGDMDVPAPRTAGLSADRRTVTTHRAPVRLVRIGRTPDNALVLADLADLAASRYHAELREFVNGERETAASGAHQNGEPAPELVNGSAREWWVAP